jgi:hypothetical protein
MSTSASPVTSLTSPGAFLAQLVLLANGSPFTPEAGSSFVFSPTLTADDTTVVIAPDATTPALFDITIPAGDTGTSVTFTANGTDPNGNPIPAATLTLPFAAVAQTFSIGISISAAPVPAAS